MPDETTQRRRERPTLKTISQASGLAVTTVSRALGDAPDISAETKQKVRKIAEELGYVPDRAGVRLRTGRTKVIALILPTENEVINMTPRLISSIAGALSGTGYHLVVVPELPTQKTIDPVRYVVETRSADALILNRITPEDERIAYLRAREFPFATHGRSIWADTHAYYDFDNRAFAALALERLAERGRTTCILIAPPADQTYGMDVIEGAEEAAERLGVKLIVADRTSDDSSADIAASIEAALRANPDADALISASPHAAMSAVKVIEGHDHTLGETFDIFAKETFPILEMFRDGILTISEDIEAAGRFLAKAALHEVRDQSKGHMQMIETPKLSVQSD